MLKEKQLSAQNLLMFEIQGVQHISMFGAKTTVIFSGHHLVLVENNPGMYDTSPLSSTGA